MASLALTLDPEPGRGRIPRQQQRGRQLTTKAERRARRKREKDALEARKWVPQDSKSRPTPERLAKGGMKAKGGRLDSLGSWTLEATEDAGVTAAKDASAHPIDDLEFRGVISNDQASAGRDFERLYRHVNGNGGIRDSSTLFEPKGFDNDDGDANAERDRQELYLFLGVVRDRLLRRVCVHHEQPDASEVGLIREALNEAARFFK